jgi:hypothetical protein
MNYWREKELIARETIRERERVYEEILTERTARRRYHLDLF